MKTHLSRSLGTAHLTVAALAIAVASSVSAQTVITPDLKAPPGAYNTSSPGMVLRAHQIALTRSPGNQNSIENVLKELSGGFGPSLSGATNGPLTGGLWSADYLNYALDPNFPVDFDSQWHFFSAPTLPFPGIETNTNLTSGVSTFAYEIITYLNLPAGTTTLVVGSGDSFLLTIGVSDNPFSFAAVQPANGVFSGSRNYDVNNIVLDVQSAGVYPVRIIYGQGGGTAGLQFYSVVDGAAYLINDPNGAGIALTAYRPASLPITPTKAYVSLLAPVPGETGTSPVPTVRAELTDGVTTTVNTNTISLSLDSVSVPATITQTGKVTYVSYTVPSTLASLSVHTAKLVAQDSAANVLSNQWSFTVGTFTIVPASWAYPVGSGDATKPGFAGKVHQLRADAFVSTSVATAEAQLAGELIDTATGQPYINMVVTNGNPIVGAGWPGTQPAEAGGGPGEARTFTVTSNINYSIADGTGAVLDGGNFTSANGYPDALFPGLPGSTDATFLTYDNAVELAVEVVGWIELPAGTQQIGVNCGDGFQLAISPNNARDLFRTSLGQYELDRGAVDTTATLFVETNGVYSFRLLFRSFRNNLPSQLEWFRYDPANPNQRVLINDTVAGAVKSYRALTVPTRPYVKSVTPAPGDSGVSSTAPVKVVLVNLGTNTPVLKVGGATVAYTSVTNGNEVTLTYTPPAPLAGLVHCEVTYAGAVGHWTYAVRTGQKALFIISGGGTVNTAEQFLAARLAVKYGLDVEFLDVNLTGADANLSYASNKVLILVSSSIASGAIANWAVNFMTSGVTVPVMNWEYGNCDEWGFYESGGGNGSGSGQAVDITGAPHPLTAGLTNGLYNVYDSSQTQGYYNNPVAGTIVVGMVPGTANVRIGAVTNGTVVNTPTFGGGVPVTHASRKVFMGILYNSNGHLLNNTGLALFDTAVEWLLPPVLTATAGPGAGQMTLGWTSSGTLQTATNLAAPTWISAPSQSNPQTVPTTGTQRYYRVRQ